MWINKDVSLPEPLVTSQREGKLVVFVGAGVSMGPPSNLPSFARLSEQIAEGVLLRQANEPFDVFLGRLEARGVDVQSRTRTILGAPKSAPTPVHHGLVALFGAADRVRIVTTNFDAHLTTALRAQHNGAVDIFCAPALPLGREFRGLIYLHGSLDRRERLVLTDTDFGLAYLTDGWATRFLTEMFSRYAVLFVGYGHEDPVMRYIARSLVGRPNIRFSLVQPGNDEHWLQLGIAVVHYPERPAPDQHGALREAIEAWANTANVGLLESERRIEQILQAAPPLEREIADYIESATGDVVTLRFFVTYAKSPEWLEWADSKGLFDDLFTPGRSGGEVSSLVATWFASNYAVEHPRKAIDLVRRHGMTWMSAVLWNALAAELSRHDPPPEAATLAAWVLVLTQTLGQNCHADYLSFILVKSRTLDESESALILLQSLATPRISLQEHWPGFDTGADRPLGRVEVKLAGDGYHLRQAWVQYFKPNLPTFHRSLISLFTACLSDAHRMQRAAGAATDTWDPLSFSRAAIEPHEQDEHPDDWEFLVEGARDLLEWLLANEEPLGRALIEAWSNAQSPLLRRLAVHGMARDPQLKAAEALKRIERRNWLRAVELKHEVFALIKRYFPSASSVAQKRLVRYSMRQEPKEGAAADAAADASHTEEYERYNLARWLTTVAPKSRVARRHLEELERKHPQFGAREYPDLSHSMSVGFIEPKSPITAADLVRADPSTQIEWLLTFNPQQVTGREPDREGLLGAIQEAAAQSFRWPWRLAQLLVERANWESDLWPRILAGWKESAKSGEEWAQVLGLLSEHPELDHGAVRDECDLLDHGVEKGEIAGEAALGQVEQLGDRFIQSADEEATVHTVGRKDWLTQAINHIGGRVAMLWLKLLSARRDEKGADWQGLPEAYRARLETVIADGGANRRFARIVVASQTHFLFNLDRAWTKERLLPLFDWTRDAAGAEQAWFGFLGWGQWNDGLFSEMRPYVEQSFVRLGDVLSEERDALCLRLASVAAYSMVDPWHDGWLRVFVSEADDESRVQWARSFTHVLRSLPPERTKTLWDQWLKDYWTDRFTGVPRAIADGEKTEMLGWAAGLSAVFDEVVAKLAAAPPTEISGLHLHLLVEGKLAQSHPRAMGHLLRHLLAGVVDVDYSCKEIFALAKDALSGGAARDDVTVVAEAMARLGCPEAGDLRRLVEERQ